VAISTSGRVFAFQGNTVEARSKMSNVRGLHKWGTSEANSDDIYLKNSIPIGKVMVYGI